MINHSDYINSDEWKAKRTAFFESDFHKKYTRKGYFTCYACDCDPPLDLHHRTYENFGNEDIENDLVPVCRKCHEAIHDYHKRTGKKKSLWVATNRERKRYQKNPIRKLKPKQNPKKPNPNSKTQQRKLAKRKKEEARLLQEKNLRLKILQNNKKSKEQRQKREHEFVKYRKKRVDMNHEFTSKGKVVTVIQKSA